MGLAERGSMPCNDSDAPKISDKTLTGHLTELANEWAAVLNHQAEHGRKATLDGKGSNIWWLNQTAYLAERFGIALIDDLLTARGLPPRTPALPGTQPSTPKESSA